LFIEDSEFESSSVTGGRSLDVVQMSQIELVPPGFRPEEQDRIFLDP
jgi:hypothetical protein